MSYNQRAKKETTGHNCSLATWRLYQPQALMLVGIDVQDPNQANLILNDTKTSKKHVEQARVLVEEIAERAWPDLVNSTTRLVDDALRLK